jgi:hypothetical protein
MFHDKLDCSHLSFPFTGPLLSKNTDICKTTYHQKSDKITDSICYGLLLIYILENKNMQNKCLITFLFVFRIIGTSLFLISENRKYLFYFPNFFLEICLGLMLVDYYQGLNRYKTTILLSIVIYKIIVEYYLHIKNYLKS